MGVYWEYRVEIVMGNLYFTVCKHICPQSWRWRK